MEMMLDFNALERDEKRWKQLFERADPQLELLSSKMTPGNIHAIMVLGLKQN